MLPGVNTQQRHIGARNRVLVGARNQAKGATRLVLDQPRPAAALDAGQRRVQLRAEGVEGAKVGVDCFLSGVYGLARWGLWFGRRNAP